SVSPELRESMLLRGEVDAIVGHIWTQAIGLRAGGADLDDVEVLAYGDHGIDTLGSILVVRPEWAEKNGDAIRSFIKCVVEGINDAIEDPDGAIASLKKQDPLINEKTEMDRFLYSFDFAILTDNVKENGMHSLDDERFERIAKISADAYGVDAPKRDEIFNENFLPDQADLKITHELTRKVSE